MPVGGVISAPNAPMPPALATAIDKLAGHAPAMGASRMGSFSPYFVQNSEEAAFVILHSSCAQGSPDDDLGFFLDALQVTLAFEALRVDFVNVLGA